ncbi:substrate-binding domain-containing protein [Okeania sp. SIO3I5]|uniref:substrate-binding domain-containing protein n=1 Tax=Okeania sp. SIO3I5 TaxID=2607805 RepID=UPI0025E66DDE|nr:substrate-binding domain-containing protein [Okeania sp. SIO3I5]
MKISLTGIMKLKNLLIAFMGILTVATVTSCTGNSDFQETAQKEIKIGGSSEGYPIMEILADAYENNSIEFTFMPSSQSSGGIRGVKDGLINIGVISQQLTTAETPENLKYIPIVKNFLVLITNENVKGVSNLSTEQIQGIYNGTISNWKDLGGPDAKIILLDIAEDETEKQILRENILGENLQVISTAIIFQEDDEVLEAVATTPYSIGVMPNSEELKEFAVNLLSINNAIPNKVNVQNGKYKISQTIGIVFSAESTSVTEEFIDFIVSQEAKEKLELANYIVEKN